MSSCDNFRRWRTARTRSPSSLNPRNCGWYDASGNENGDRCAWAFNGPITFSTSVTNPDGTVTTTASTWKLQGE